MVHPQIFGATNNSHPSSSCGWKIVFRQMKSKTPLVGGWATPLKNTKVSWDDYSIYGKIKNVPNHQPANIQPPNFKRISWFSIFSAHPAPKCQRYSANHNRTPVYMCLMFLDISCLWSVLNINFATSGFKITRIWAYLINFDNRFDEAVFRGNWDPIGSNLYTILGGKRGFRQPLHDRILTSIMVWSQTKKDVNWGVLADLYFDDQGNPSGQSSSAPTKKTNAKKKYCMSLNMVQTGKTNKTPKGQASDILHDQSLMPMTHGWPMVALSASTLRRSCRMDSAAHPWVV